MDKILKMIKYILLLTSIQFSFAQSDINNNDWDHTKARIKVETINRLMVNAENAYNSNDFHSAKTKYLLVTKKDSLNKDAWFNLGATELALNNLEIGCQYVLKSYYLQNDTAWEALMQFCPGFLLNGPMSSKNVDEPVKFVLDGIQYNLTENETVNKVLVNHLKRKLIERKDLMRGVKEVIVAFNIDKYGQFHKDLILVKGGDKNLPKSEYILKIFENVKFIPSKYKNENVGLWKYEFKANIVF